MSPNYILLSSRYGLILNYEFEISYCNPMLMDAMGMINPSGLADVFGCDGQKRINSVLLESAAKKIQVRTELQVDFGNGILPVFIEVTPSATCKHADLYLLFHPIEARRTLEKQTLVQMSRYLTDNQWILDESFRTTYFSADPESIFYGRDFPGFSILEAISLTDRSKVISAFNRANEQCGEIISINVNVERLHEILDVEADIMYIPDLFYGGRYYIVSRPVRVSLLRLAPGQLERVAEAYRSVGKVVNSNLDLARCLDIDPSIISRIKKSGHELPAKLLQTCCLETKVRLPWLHNGSGRMKDDG